MKKKSLNRPILHYVTVLSLSVNTFSVFVHVVLINFLTNEPEYKELTQLDVRISALCSKTQLKGLDNV